MKADPVIRILRPADLDLLAGTGKDVFDKKVNKKLAAEFLSCPRHHIAVAIVKGKIVGFASGFHYIHPDKSQELFVNEVGVSQPYRRQGLGKKVLKALVAHGRKLGCKEAWLMTEKDNIPARRLYTAAGAKEQTVVYFTLKKKAGKS